MLRVKPTCERCQEEWGHVKWGYLVDFILLPDETSLLLHCHPFIVIVSEGIICRIPMASWTPPSTPPGQPHFADIFAQSDIGFSHLYNTNNMMGRLESSESGREHENFFETWGLPEPRNLPSKSILTPLALKL